MAQWKNNSWALTINGVRLPMPLIESKQMTLCIQPIDTRETWQQKGGKVFGRWKNEDQSGVKWLDPEKIIAEGVIGHVLVRIKTPEGYRRDSHDTERFIPTHAN
jgi:hypothetical protein